MTLRNTTSSFGSVAKLFHWLIALFIIALLIVGFFMDDISDHDTKLKVFNLHKLFGLTVLLLVILRLLWRSVNIVPAMPFNTPAWEIVLERSVKFFLYLAMFVMPVSGWIFSTAANHAPHLGAKLFPAPFIPINKALSDQVFVVHQFTAFVLIGLLCLHIAGGVKHHFINKDNVLRRMLP